MTKEELKKLKDNKEIKFIYKIPCSFYKEGYEYVLIGNIENSHYDNVRSFSLDDWFLRIRSGSLLPYVCSTLSRAGKIKEYLNIYEKPNLLGLRNFLLHSKNEFEILQESLWGLQVIKESKVNRPDVFKQIYSTAKDELNNFLVATEPMYKMNLSKHNGK